MITSLMLSNEVAQRPFSHLASTRSEPYSTDRPSDEMRSRPAADRGRSGGHDSFQLEVFRHNIDALERAGGPHGLQLFLEPVGPRNRLHQGLQDHPTRASRTS